MKYQVQVTCSRRQLFECEAESEDEAIKAVVSGDLEPTEVVENNKHITAKLAPSK